MDTLIRQAEACDIERVLSLCKKQCEFNRENHSPASLYDAEAAVLQAVVEKMRTSFQNRDGDTLFLLADKGQATCGYAVAKIYTEDPAADAGTGRTGLLEKLFLTEEARGSGLGQALMDEVMEWFQGKGIRRVRVEPYGWNERAKAFYEKCGFQEYSVTYEKFM